MTESYSVIILQESSQSEVKLEGQAILKVERDGGQSKGLQQILI